MQNSVPVVPGLPGVLFSPSSRPPPPGEQYAWLARLSTNGHRTQTTRCALIRVAGATTASPPGGIGGRLVGMGSRPAPGCAGGIGNAIGAGIGIGMGGPIPAGGGGGGKAMIGNKPPAVSEFQRSYTL